MKMCNVLGYKLSTVNSIPYIQSNIYFFSMSHLSMICVFFILEQRDLKMKKKHMQQQLKQEDQMLELSKRWASEILPNWELT